MKTILCSIAIVGFAAASFTLFAAEEIDFGIDFQMNAVAQIERAFDGTFWGITSTTQESMPTVAGVYTFISTNGGLHWDSSCVTPNWWRWGQEIAAISVKEAWVIAVREDTTEMYRTVDRGKRWTIVSPSLTRISKPFAIHFYSPFVGVVIGQEGRAIERKWVVSRTTDGGVTWKTSLPMLAEPATEQPAERNDRSFWAQAGEVFVGMSSGRVLFSLDSGQSWKFMRTPLGGSVNSIARISESRLLVVNTTTQGLMRPATTTDYGASWNTLVQLPQDTPPLHGLRLCPDGSIVTIPNELTKTPLTKIAIDLSSARIISALAGYSVEAQLDGTYLVGAEIVPGQGMRRVTRK